MTPDDRNRGLDALRGLAALAVVLFHYTHRYDELYGHDQPVPMLRLGSYGVHLFFMISGFVILTTLLRCRRSQDFAVSRATRLIPTYWLAIALTFTVVSAVGLPGREAGPVTALHNLTMVQNQAGLDNVDGVYWSLGVELSFYLLMWALWRTGLLVDARRLPVLAGLVVASGAVQVLVFDRAGSDAAGPLVLSRYLHLFAFGIVTYDLVHGRLRRSPGLLLCLVAGVAAWEWVVTDSAESAGVIAVLAVLFLLGAHGALSRLHVRPVLLLGTVSYALYLTHQNLGYVALRALRSAGVPSAVGVLLTLLAAVALAAAMTFLWERPVARWVKERYRARSARPAGEPSTGPRTTTPG